MNILVFDSYTISRIGVSMSLNEISESIKVHSEGNVENAINLLQLHKPEVVMVNSEGSENFLSAIASKDKSNKCVVYYNDFKIALSVKESFEQVLGMISLKSDINEFSNCINIIKRGGPFYCNVTFEILLNEVNFESSELFGLNGKKISPQLTFRENQIKNLLIEGRSTREIGGVLNLKDSTISTNKNKIFKKLGVNNLVELIRMTSGF